MWVLVYTKTLWYLQLFYQENFCSIAKDLYVYIYIYIYIYIYMYIYIHICRCIRFLTGVNQQQEILGVFRWHVGTQTCQFSAK